MKSFFKDEKKSVKEEKKEESDNVLAKLTADMDSVKTKIAKFTKKVSKGKHSKSIEEINKKQEDYAKKSKTIAAKMQDQVYMLRK